MRLPLLALLCTLSFTASAQWLSFKKHERFPLLTQVQDHSVKRFPVAQLARQSKITTRLVNRSDYNLELNEYSVMKTAQHNMRFRVYDVASYNFSDLAKLYVQQNRYSEAKWFFLQSSFLSRQQSNDKLTIANLLNLAGIKSQIGDFVLAQQDLLEAREMAASHGWLIDLIQVEKKLKTIQNNRIMSARSEMRYASNALITASAVE